MSTSRSAASVDGRLTAGDPRHVAVDHEDHVGLGEHRVLRHRVILEAGVQRVIGGEFIVYGLASTTGIASSSASSTRLGTAAGFAPQVGGHDQRVAGARERAWRSPR